MANRSSRREVGTLKNWLWEAACVIRGAIDAHKVKDYILCLGFLKRLSDFFEDLSIVSPGSQRPLRRDVERVVNKGQKVYY